MRLDVPLAPLVPEAKPAVLSGNAEWLWADPATHPDAELTPTTVFAPIPERFQFRVFEFEKTYHRRTPSPGLLSVTVFADPAAAAKLDGMSFDAVKFNGN